MFQGQYLFHGVTVFSPWMRREGDNIRATVELLDQSSGSIGIEVRVFTKEDEANGDGDDADSMTTISTATVGLDYATWSGNLNDLVRYQMKVSGGSAATDFILFRMLPPVWFDSVKAS